MRAMSTTKQLKAETSARSAWRAPPARLDHEVADGAVEGGAGVVAALGQRQEVLARARRDVAVQLQVQVAQAGVQAHVRLGAWAALHADLRGHAHGHYVLGLGLRVGQAGVQAHVRLGARAALHAHLRGTRLGNCSSGSGFRVGVQAQVTLALGQRPTRTCAVQGMVRCGSSADFNLAHTNISHIVPIVTAVARTMWHAVLQHAPT